MRVRILFEVFLIFSLGSCIDPARYLSSDVKSGTDLATALKKYDLTGVSIADLEKAIPSLDKETWAEIIRVSLPTRSQSTSTEESQKETTSFSTTTTGPAAFINITYNDYRKVNDTLKCNETSKTGRGNFPWSTTNTSFICCDPSADPCVPCVLTYAYYNRLDNSSGNGTTNCTAVFTTTTTTTTSGTTTCKGSSCTKKPQSTSTSATSETTKQANDEESTQLTTKAEKPVNSEDKDQSTTSTTKRSPGNENEPDETSSTTSTTAGKNTDSTETTSTTRKTDDDKVTVTVKTGQGESDDNTSSTGSTSPGTEAGKDDATTASTYRNVPNQDTPSTVTGSTNGTTVKRSGEFGVTTGTGTSARTGTISTSTINGGTYPTKSPNSSDPERSTLSTGSKGTDATTVSQKGGDSDSSSTTSNGTKPTGSTLSTGTGTVTTPTVSGASAGQTGTTVSDIPGAVSTPSTVTGTASTATRSNVSGKGDSTSSTDTTGNGSPGNGATVSGSNGTSGTGSTSPNSPGSNSTTTTPSSSGNSSVSSYSSGSTVSGASGSSSSTKSSENGTGSGGNVTSTTPAAATTKIMADGTIILTSTATAYDNCTMLIEQTRKYTNGTIGNWFETGCTSGMPIIPEEFTTIPISTTPVGKNGSVTVTTPMATTTRTLPDGTKVLWEDATDYPNCTMLITQGRLYPNGTASNFTQWFDTGCTFSTLSTPKNSVNSSTTVTSTGGATVSSGTGSTSKSNSLTTMGTGTTRTGSVGTIASTKSTVNPTTPRGTACPVTGFQNTTTSTILVNGTFMVQTCTTGYTFTDGAPMKIFECVRGAWSGLSNDSCQANSCPPLSINLSNAQSPSSSDSSLSSRQAIGKLVVHSCKSRYVFPSGEPLRVYECVAGGTWSGAVGSDSCQHVEL